MAYHYAIDFNKMDYVLEMIELDPAYDTIVRPIFDSFAIEFRDRMPREIWGMVDAVEIMYQGYMDKDTAKLIQSFRMITEHGTNRHNENSYQLGKYQILFGEYAEGKKLIEQFIQGQYRSNNGNRFLACQWLLGRAYEGLGETTKAIEKYEEFLGYWGKADIQIKSIRDAKERLAKLSS